MKPKLAREFDYNPRGDHCFGHPGRGASQVEKPARLNWVTHFLTVEYSGARSPNISLRTA
jgi:hypothetical protein